jgi:hypothetical protein
MISLNTHDYDNKVKEIYQKLITEDKSEDPLTNFTIVLQEVFIFVRDFQTINPTPELPQLKSDAYKTLVLFKKDTKSNSDQNGLSVEDLLPRIWRVIDRNEPDSIIYFIEQLADVITKGPCSNGRINRLLQVYKCLVEVEG